MTEAGVKCPACGQYTFAEENNFDICRFADGKTMVYSMMTPTMRVVQIPKALMSIVSFGQRAKHGCR